MFVSSLLSIDFHLVLIAVFSSSPNPVLLKQLIKVFRITTNVQAACGQAGDKLCRMLVLHDTTVLQIKSHQEQVATSFVICWNKKQPDLGSGRSRRTRSSEIRQSSTGAP